MNEFVIIENLYPWALMICFVEIGANGLILGGLLYLAIGLVVTWIASWVTVWLLPLFGVSFDQPTVFQVSVILSAIQIIIKPSTPNIARQWVSNKLNRKDTPYE